MSYSDIQPTKTTETDNHLFKNIRSESEKVDVLVIGAGPAGTIAASIIHKAGYKVKIVEKLLFPRFVIGESLLPRCMEALEEADFLNALNQKNYQKKFGAKFVRGNEIFDINFSEAHTEGHTWTWQVPRADFDLTLAQECQKKGIDVQFQTEVTNIQINADETSTTEVINIDGSKSYIDARFIIDGSGYGRVIPKLFQLEKPSHLPARQAFFTHFKDDLRHLRSDEPNRITIYIYDSTTWVWYIPFSNGTTSVGFVGYPEFFKDLEGTDETKLRNLITSHKDLAMQFSKSEMLFPPMTLQSWSSTTDQFFGNGYVLTGNVTEFLDPIFSSGVTLASVSSQNAAHLVIKKLKGENVDWQKDYMDVCMKGVDVFRTFVMSWYNQDLHSIFFANNKNIEMKKQISSILAGYVWDDTNPFVKQHDKYVKQLARFLKTREHEL